MAHTPGPWQALPEHGRIVLNGSAIYGVADITGDYANWNSDDLRLMAAAPELLEALRSAVAVLSGWECTSKLDAGDTQTVRLCKAALSKAEGRAS